MVAKNYTTEVLVVGGGPGGYVAAIRSAQLGKTVTLVDKGRVGGVCLNRGCIPSKALISAAESLKTIDQLSDLGIDVGKPSIDFPRMMEWKDGVVKKLINGVSTLLKRNKINVINGEAFFHGPNTVQVITENNSRLYHFKDCIIATGSSPTELPSLPFDGHQIISSTEALELKEIPEKLLVIGGGYIGLELGTAYRKLGSKVTILEGTDSLLPSVDQTLVRVVKRNLKKLGIKIVTKAMVQGCEDANGTVTVTAEVKGEKLTYTADKVLVAVGRTPNTKNLNLEQAGITTDERGFIPVNDQMRTSNDHIYAVGDITGGALLAHKASYEGKIAAEVIAGEPSSVDFKTMPFVIFSDPEIAYAGLSKNEAEEKGYELIISKVPFQANGRALSMREPEGFVQVIAEKQSKKILGIQIVGPEASTMISEAVLAIEMGISVIDISSVIHPHPTLPESLMEAADNILGNAVHVVK
ncbi:dihydrolipoyl dehydrogenase [Marinithermofilum abyssi]|uniref:Dihydrolipoyl dehydrogenase n=1 Tax=Marinithermofilum abyssi TaxID=1571185 RepID=A0A8J2VFK2_9BACL|nr:dihydrolipoyl dehydrogenase [Marinithermofilum abyssi]GGE29630.1 dihydrolipoyl dehydrogenase [Marinithermofilum abyssi]